MVCCRMEDGTPHFGPVVDWTCEHCGERVTEKSDEELRLQKLVIEELMKRKPKT